MQTRLPYTLLIGLWISWISIQLANATHIIGGEVSYQCLGNNEYEVTLQLFRDCDTGVPWFDNPASIKVLDSLGNTVDTILMDLTSINDTLSFDDTDCAIIPGTACIHTTTYKDTVALPFLQGGYHFVYQICCRNQDIINIVDPTQTQASYHVYLSTTALLTCNHAPKFKGWPPFYICNGQALQYDHSVTDLEGDSIVYELYEPYNNYPNVVTWQVPYGLNGMLGVSLPFSIDPLTGLLSGTPLVNGTFVVGIAAKEYRNGVLLSIIQRDFQYIVTACALNVVADFEAVVDSCNTDLSAVFTNLSMPNIGALAWDFGDGSPISTQENPVHIFPDTGKYTVQLVAAEGAPCADSIAKIIDVQIRIADIEVTSAPVLCNDEKILVTAQNLYANYNQITNYAWSPPSSILSGQGTDSVWVLVSGGSFGLIVTATNNFGCEANAQEAQIDVPVENAIASFDSLNLVCNQSLTLDFSNQGIADNNQFLWLLDTLATATTYNTSYTFPDTGEYTVTLIAGVGSVCADTLDYDIVLNISGIDIALIDSQSICRNDTILLVANNLSSHYLDSINYTWTPNALILSGQGTDSVLVVASDDYTIYLEASTIEQCRDTAQSIIHVSSVSPAIDVSASPIQIYAGQTVQLSTIEQIDYTYQWQQDSTLSDWDIAMPSAKPRTTTSYYLTVQNIEGCLAMDSITIEVLPPVCDNPVVFVPSAFSPNGDGYNDLVKVEGNNIESMLFIIYNRWGQKLFETTDQSIGWDGRHQGKILPPDVYGYYMQCTCDGGGQLLLKGNITLLK